MIVPQTEREWQMLQLGYLDGYLQRKKSGSRAGDKASLAAWEEYAAHWLAKSKKAKQLTVKQASR
jgi:hypothetical protein